MRSREIVAAALLCAASSPAPAADYYVAARYTTAHDGEGQVLINADNLHTVDGGYKATDVVVVNAAGVGVVVYDAQFDCAAKTWRVSTQSDYYPSISIAPVIRTPFEPPPFVAVRDGTSIAGAMTMVCGWPASAAGADKVTASNAVTLSSMVSPGLKPAPEGPPPQDQ